MQKNSTLVRIVGAEKVQGRGRRPDLEVRGLVTTQILQQEW